MLVNSTHREGVTRGVWLHLKTLKSLVLSLSTKVRAIRDTLNR